MTSLYNKLHHVCIVVHDIDKTQAYYESIGIGPWKNYPPLSEYVQLNVPNEAGFLALKYRVCDLPNIQLQLCEPGPQDSPQRRHLDTKGESVFQLGFEVPDADRAQAESGLPVLMSGRRNNGTGFTYYDTQDEAGVNLLTRATNQPGG